MTLQRRSPLAGAAMAVFACMASDGAAETRRWIVTVGGSGLVLPEFEGSKDFEFLPLPLFNIRSSGAAPAFRMPDDGFGLALVDQAWFRAGPVGRFVRARDEDDSAVLRGLGDVDFTIEVGAFAELWPREWLRLRGEIRRGFNGHEGIVGDLGLDIVLKPSDAWLVAFGPRIGFGDQDFFDTYFAIDTRQAGRSGYAVYDPDAGLRKLGAAVHVTYDVSKDWKLSAHARYDRLSDAIADTPFVKADGSADQFTLGIGLAYSFDIGF